MAAVSLEELARNTPDGRVRRQRSDALAYEIARLSKLPIEKCRETAEFFVDRLRFSAYESIPAAEIRGELGQMASQGFLPSEAVEALNELCSLSEGAIQEVGTQLPAYPAAVL
jgi:hypothetical protein